MAKPSRGSGAFAYLQVDWNKRRRTNMKQRRPSNIANKHYILGVKSLDHFHPATVITFLGTSL